jgi:hypothetical protein
MFVVEEVPTRRVEVSFVLRNGARRQAYPAVQVCSAQPAHAAKTATLERAAHGDVVLDQACVCVIKHVCA